MIMPIYGNSHADAISHSFHVANAANCATVSILSHIKKGTPSQTEHPMRRQSLRRQPFPVAPHVHLGRSSGSDSSHRPAFPVSQWHGARSSLRRQDRLGISPNSLFSHAIVRTAMGCTCCQSEHSTKMGECKRNGKMWAHCACQHCKHHPFPIQCDCGRGCQRRLASCL